jgi:Ca-activated chloride channel homolog
MSNLTLVSVTVAGSLGRNVLGLGPENYAVCDEEEQRRIISFTREDAPVSVGIVFDSSGSMDDNMRTARAAAAELFRQLNPEEEVFRTLQVARLFGYP